MGAPSDDATTLEALTIALDHLVLRHTLTAEQARAVLRELALPVPPKRPPTLTTPPVGVPGVDAATHRPRAGGIGQPDGMGASGEGGPAVGIDPDDGAAQRRHSWVSVLGEVGGYVGAAFVLGGCIVLAGPGWDTLSRADRLGLLGGPAAALLLLSGVIAATAAGGWTARSRTGSSARRRLISTMTTLAAVLAAGAVAQVVADPDRVLVAAGVATAVCALAYAGCRSALLHLSTGIAAAATLGEAVARVTGVGDHAPWGFMLAGVLWVGLVAVHVLSERTLGVVVGAVLVFFGGEGLVLGGFPDFGHPVVGLVALAGIAGYLWTRRVAVLVVGVVALATVVPQAGTHYTGGTLEAGGVLLVTGLSIIGASVLGLLLHRSPPAHRAGHD
jgi:hypothetical protein